MGVFLKIVETIGLPATTGLIGFAAFAYERRQNHVMQQKLLELATAQIAASMKVENALEGVRAVMGAKKR